MRSCTAVRRRAAGLSAKARQGVLFVEEEADDDEGEEAEGDEEMAALAQARLGRTVVPTGSLRARQWKRFVRGPTRSCSTSCTCRSAALRYDRCCAYSSSVLAAAARGRTVDRASRSAGS